MRERVNDNILDLTFSRVILERKRDGGEGRERGRDGVDPGRSYLHRDPMPIPSPLFISTVTPYPLCFQGWFLFFNSFKNNVSFIYIAAD